MYEVDVAVVGAGAIGLACARKLSQQGLEVLVLENHADFGLETSARNSEVIHAGIYYPAGSLKARLCVSGRELLYEFCERFGVAYRRCGKLIVATSDAQVSELGKIRERARINGVTLELIDRSEALSLEPQLRCTAALRSDATGIIDSRSYMLTLLGQAEAAGATFAFGTRVIGGRLEKERIALAVNNDPEPTVIAKYLVNSAGLHAVHVARSLQGFPQDTVPTAYFAKGNYFSLTGRAPFTRLIYPVPEPGGLGTHLTLDLGGQARFGPDVEWLDTLSDPPDYSVDPLRGEKFYAEIRKYWPALADGALAPTYSGIRPKISAPNEPAADFRIDGKERHGIPNIVHLFGIESPGLTSSLAVADEVARQLSIA